MRIKKLPNGNEYKLTEHGLWVRNFTATTHPLDINRLSGEADYPRFIENEIQNSRQDLSELDEVAKHRMAVIVSDGYDFEEKQKLLLNLPPELVFIAANRTLAKWTVNHKIDYFVVNNPYAECMGLMPQHRYFPKCVVSTKTYPPFIDEYVNKGGIVCQYLSSPDERYQSPLRVICTLDDYRNPICASVHIAYKLGVKRLLLLCCDDSFKDERPAAQQLPNGLWTYPQHLVSHGALEAMLFWYGKSKGVRLGSHSSGPDYKDVPYIQQEDLVKFYE